MSLRSLFFMSQASLALALGCSAAARDPGTATAISATSPLDVPAPGGAFTLTRGPSGEGPRPPAGSECELYVGSISFTPPDATTAAQLAWHVCRSNPTATTAWKWIDGVRALTADEASRVRGLVDGLAVSHVGECWADVPELTLIDAAREIHDGRVFCATSSLYADYAVLDPLSNLLDSLATP